MVLVGLPGLFSRCAASLPGRWASRSVYVAYTSINGVSALLYIEERTDAITDPNSVGPWSLSDGEGSEATNTWSREVGEQSSVSSSVFVFCGNKHLREDEDEDEDNDEEDEDGQEGGEKHPSADTVSDLVSTSTSIHATGGYVESEIEEEDEDDEGQDKAGSEPLSDVLGEEKTEELETGGGVTSSSSPSPAPSPSATTTAAAPLTFSSSSSPAPSCSFSPDLLAACYAVEEDMAGLTPVVEGNLLMRRHPSLRLAMPSTNPFPTELGATVVLLNPRLNPSPWNEVFGADHVGALYPGLGSDQLSSGPVNKIAVGREVNEESVLRAVDVLLTAIQHFK